MVIHKPIEFNRIHTHSQEQCIRSCRVKVHKKRYNMPPQNHKEEKSREEALHKNKL